MLVDVARMGALLDIQRVRKLNFPGEVLVNEGEQVLPGDVIVEKSFPDEIVMIDLASSLGVDRGAVKEFMVRQPGEDLQEGDVIAQIVGRFPRLVRSPVSGHLTALHEGKAVFEVGHTSQQVQAGLVGVVQSVIPEYGAILSTTGLLLQGAWGNGKIGYGELQVLEETWLKPFDPPNLDDLNRQAVLAAGTCIDEGVINDLVALGSTGLIFGTMAPELIQKVKMAPMPIIVLQGFGKVQSDLTVLEWLKPHVGKPISLNACKFDRLTGARPEVIISMETEAIDGSLNVKEELCVGHKVQIFSGKAMGKVGEVVKIPESNHLFQSGLLLPAAVVQLNHGEEVTVAQQNLAIVN